MLSHSKKQAETFEGFRLAFWLIIYEACYKYQRKMLRQSGMNLGYVTENRGNSNDCFGKILTIP